MTRRSPTLIATALLLAASAGRAADKTENNIRSSVVRITATQRLPSLLEPWMKLNPHEVKDIAVKIGRSPATVERKLALIRKTLAKDVER